MSAVPASPEGKLNNSFKEVQSWISFHPVCLSANKNNPCKKQFYLPVINICFQLFSKLMRVDEILKTIFLRFWLEMFFLKIVRLAKLALHKIMFAYRHISVGICRNRCDHHCRFFFTWSRFFTYVKLRNCRKISPNNFFYMWKFINNCFSKL